MMWMALGVLTLAWLGLHTLSLLGPEKKTETEVDTTLANVLKDHITRAENGPTSKKERN